MEKLVAAKWWKISMIYTDTYIYIYTIDIADSNSYQRSITLVVVIVCLLSELKHLLLYVFLAQNQPCRCREASLQEQLTVEWKKKRPVACDDWY